MFNATIHPPQYLFIEITTECNLRCKQCHMWMSKENKDSLTTDEKLEIVKQFYQLNSKGIVVLTGGETMSKENEFFQLTELCRNLGLTSAANTNATLINAENLEKTLTRGPKYLVVSLDSHLENIHDYIRGVKGCYQKVTDVLRRLVALKKQKYPDIDTRIITNTIIFDKNIAFWKDYIAFAKEDLQIDGVMFQMLSRTFWNRKNTDIFFDKHFVSTEKTQNVIDDIMTTYKNDDFVLTKHNDFQWMKLYAQNPDFIGEQVCGSHERNIMIDQYGDVQLCFSMRGLMNGQILGNVKTQKIGELWTSIFAEKARDVMSICRQNCGMLNCHRKKENA